MKKNYLFLLLFLGIASNVSFAQLTITNGEHNLEITGAISGYYNSLEELKSIYGDDSNWVIAECIFEQESGLY
jgi:hypothetical protein